jgi:hypothetical protein
LQKYVRETGFIAGCAQKEEARSKTEEGRSKTEEGRSNKIKGFGMA